MKFVTISTSPKYFNGLFIREINVVHNVQKNIVEIPFKLLGESSNNDIILLLDLFVTMYRIRDDEDNQSLFNELFIELFDEYPETIISLLEDDSNFRHGSSKCVNRIRDTFLKEVMSKDSSFSKSKK